MINNSEVFDINTCYFQNILEGECLELLIYFMVTEVLSLGGFLTVELLIRCTKPRY